MPAGKTIHLFLNGELKNSAPVRDLVSDRDVLVAVDGGLRHIFGLGMRPDLLIGDLDSVTEGEIQKAQSSGSRVMRFPMDKDQTDFELALDEAFRLAPTRIYIHAALGGRMDQTLANLSLVGADRYSSIPVVILDGNDSYQFIRQSLIVHGQAGDTVSLLPWGGPADGVSTRNMKYPLHTETLLPDRSRGISNIMTAEQAEVKLTKGRLLCVHTRKSF